MSSDFQSEAALEEQFMRKLQSVGYKNIKLADEAAVLNHFREILNERNVDNLKGQKLSDVEFERVLNELVGSKSLFEIAQLLRGSDVQPYGKIVITRDDNSELYLEFFDGVDFSHNTYEVAHQITINAKYTNRYDVTVLVNGLPIAQIELKRRGTDFGEAFNQIIRYRDESYRQLFRFVQIFVVSNGDETRYFANGDGKLNANFMFYWTNQNNEWLNDIDAFTSSFFDLKRFHSLIADYTIFDNDQSRMLIMRPYQVYATEAILLQAKENPHENGYIWHTTGSGKTITSFKASRLIAQKTNAEKVIFLIDRSDLDIQTAKNFNSYLPNSSSSEPALDRTKSTRKLVEQLGSKDNSLIVTTIQKLNNAISGDRYKKLLESFHDKHVVFIEDEAHRSQFGEMRKNVNKWFQNAQHFGFTGTPIFAENVGPDGRTTETLYGKCLHKYLIKDAIRDHNVLGFSIQYLNTIKGHDVFLDGSDEVSGIKVKEAFENEDRLKMIVQHIMLNHDQITDHRRYNAILTVPDTSMALKYYHTFKELDKNNNFNVTSIFTWAANENGVREKQTGDEHPDQVDELTSRHGLDRVIDDYNAMYGTSFSTDDFKGYFADVSKRMKAHNDRTPKDNIDILIVVNMFLTGFDSPKLSTLYSDKKLKWHGLIQAFSRTNRVEQQSKPSGNIVTYRNIKKQTDDAVKLFSAGSSKYFFVPTYEDLLSQLENAIHDLHQVAPTPESVDKLHNIGDEALKDFVLAFREVLRVHNRIRVYDDFEWANLEDFTDGDMQRYRSKYSVAYEDLKRNTPEKGEKVSFLNDIDFEIELLASDQIDVQYISNLVKAIDLENAANQQADVHKIKHLLENADNPDLRLKANLINEFLDEIIPKLEPNDNVSSELSRYLANKREESVSEFSEETKLPEAVVQKQIDNYEFYGSTNSRELTKELNEIGYGFKQQISIKQRVTNFVKETLRKFVMS